MRLSARLFLHAEEHGGLVYPAPTDVFFTESNVVEPDVVFVAKANLAKVEEKFVRPPPTWSSRFLPPTSRCG